MKDLGRRVCVCVCVCVCVRALCLTLRSPMDCSPPGFPVHGILQARTQEEHFLLQEIFRTQGLNPRLLCLLYWQADS